jgi:hypothetical protein
MGTNHESTVRTAIVDKNGKQTTVHKKPAVATSNSRLMNAAPKLGAGTTPKPYKPIKSQTERRVQNMSVSVRWIDDRIKVDTRHVNGAGRLDISCGMSDVAIYGVLSSVDSAHDAVALMQFGVASGDNAREALRRFGAEDLGADADRSALVQAAFERRIPATEFIAFDQSYSHHCDDTEKYLDAAEAYASRTLRESSYSSTAPHNLILAGRISFRDVKDVGIQNFSRAHCKGRLGQMVAELNEQDHPAYTAAQLGEVIKRSEGKRNHEEVGVKMLEKCGGEFVSTIRDIGSAIEVAAKCIESGDDDWNSAIRYVEEFRVRRFRNLHEVYDLHKLGVDLEFAVEKSEEMDKYTVHEIAGMYAGVAPAMVDGWL